MSFFSHSMLPSGLYDLLAPLAAHERFVSGKLLETFERFCYEQVSPPLMEFENSLLSGPGGKALAPQTFRVMDTISPHMLGFRPDITLQVGRIAISRLSDHPRPLRLCYSGSTLRVKGEGRTKARQWRQAGFELIGVQNSGADAEVIALALHSLESLNIEGLVVDINLPGLVKTVLDDAAIPPSRHEIILQAIQCKDIERLRALDIGSSTKTLIALIEAVGSADKTLEQLERISLPALAKDQVAYVRSVINQLHAIGINAEITIDAVENRGFEYHTLISFSLFSRIAQMELGRGGRYRIDTEDGEESATGCTLYVNSLMEVVPVQPPLPKLLVAAETPLAICLQWQREGYAVLRGQVGHQTSANEAHRLACSHVLVKDKAIAVTELMR